MSERSLADLKLDGYEQKLINQITVLSSKYAEHLSVDQSLALKKESVTEKVEKVGFNTIAEAIRDAKAVVVDSHDNLLPLSEGSSATLPDSSVDSLEIAQEKSLSRLFIEEKNINVDNERIAKTNVKQ